MVDEFGFYVIICLGFYICGEWWNGGILDWLIDEYLEILVKGLNGLFFRDIYYLLIMYFYFIYLEVVGEWYNVVFLVIRKYLYINGGLIISVLIDDELLYWEIIF